MSGWPLDEFCAREYADPLDRRFHAQPLACPSCGPGYCLEISGERVHGSDESIRRSAELLAAGKIIAVKGLGGYHLACDAQNAAAVQALRDRKYRKEKPFALMVQSVEAARKIVELSIDAEALLTSPARPIMLARAKRMFAGVAPTRRNLA